MTNQEDVSLETLAGGAVVERWNDELMAVLKNIGDPNTTLAKRTITLKVSIKPDKDRDLGQIDIECKSSLAPSIPLGTKIYIGYTKDGPVATEYNPQQPNLPLEEKATVTPLRTVGGNQP